MSSILQIGSDVCQTIGNHLDIVKRGISERSAHEIAVPVAVIGSGVLACVHFGVKAVDAKSRQAQFGYGLLAAGGMALAIAGTVLSVSKLVENGCHAILEEFAGHIPDYYYRCDEFIGRGVSKIIYHKPV